MKLIRILMFLLLIFILTIPSLSSTQTRVADKIYKVAVLPFLIHSQENLDYIQEGIYDILSSRILMEGKIVVIERPMVERALYEERPMRLDETVAKKIGMRVGADYIILGSLTKIGDYISLDARLISITEEKPPLGAYTQHKGLDDVMVKIGDFAQDIGYKILGRRATVGRPYDSRSSSIIKPSRQIGSIEAGIPDFKKTQTFDFEIKGIDIGDVDRDKKNELVAIDQHNLYIFKYDGDRLRMMQKIEHGYEHNFLSLDVADVNQNGSAEIIVNSVVGDDLRSFILEYEEGKFKTVVKDADWFFRVLHHPKDGLMLMGEKMGPEGLPFGPIYNMVWKKKSFEKGPRMPFPKETTIFGFTLADIRSQGMPDVIMLDDSEYIKIVSTDGKFTWKSREKYGGTANSYDTEKKKVPGFKYDAPNWRVYIPGRVIVKDLDGDGLNEVIVNKNHSSFKLLDRTRSFSAGEIQSLVWEYDNLITLWKTREISGYVADYQIKDADNDGEEELVVASVGSLASGMIGGKGTSNIIFFKLF